MSTTQQHRHNDATNEDDDDNTPIASLFPVLWDATPAASNAPGSQHVDDISSKGRHHKENQRYHTSYYQPSSGGTTPRKGSHDSRRGSSPKREGGGTSSPLPDRQQHLASTVAAAHPTLAQLADNNREYHNVRQRDDKERKQLEKERGEKERDAIAGLDLMPASYFACSKFTLWYKRPATEQQFLVHELKRNGYRMFGFATLLAIFLSLHAALLPSSAYQSANIGAACLIFVLCGIDLAVLRLFNAQMRRKGRNLWSLFHTSSSQGKSHHNGHKKGSGKNTSKISSSSSPSTTPDRTSLVVFFGFFHEFLGIVNLCLAIFSTFATYPRAQDTCRYLHVYDEDRSNNIQCHHVFFPMIATVTLIPTILGTPRFVISAVFLAITCISLPFATSYHDTTSLGRIITFILIYVLSVFGGALKYIDEVQNRICFEADVRLEERRARIAEENEAFRKFALAVTPAHLHHSIFAGGESSTLVHISDDALCLVADIADVSKFMTSMRPADAARAVGMFSTMVYKQCDLFGSIVHIRNVGDMNYVAANLIVSNINNNPKAGQRPSAAQQVRAGAGATETDVALACQQLVMCSLCILKHAPENVPARCAIARGRIIGMPLGELCVRYDIFGEPVDAAHEIVLSSPAKVTASQYNVAPLLPTHTFTVTPDVEHDTDRILITAAQSMSPNGSNSNNNSNIQQFGQIIIPNPLDPSAAVYASGSDDSEEPDGITVGGGRMNSFSSGDGNENRDGGGGNENEKPRRAPRYYGEIDLGVAVGTLIKPSSASKVEDSTKPLEIVTSSISSPTSHGGVVGDFPAGKNAGGATASFPTKPNLTLQNNCLCCIDVYQDPAVEDEFENYARGHAFSAFKLGNAFFACLSVLVLASTIEQRFYTMDLELHLSFGIHGANFILFVLLASLNPPPTLAMSELRTRIRPWMAHTSFAGCLLSTVAMHLSRPSRVGDDPTPFVVTFCIAQVVMGGKIRDVLLFQFGVFTVSLVCLLYRPVVGVSLFFSATLVFIAANTAVVRNRSSRTLFSDHVCSFWATAELQRNHSIRKAITSALVPRQLTHLLTARTIHYQKLETWCIDEAVVIELAVHFPLTAAGGGGGGVSGIVASRILQSGSSSLSVPPAASAGSTTSGGGSRTRQLPNKMRQSSSSIQPLPISPSTSSTRQQQLSADSSAPSSSTVAAGAEEDPKMLVEHLRSFAQETTVLIETAVAACPGRRLDIVKTFGSTVTIAGPLATRDDQSSREQRGEDVLVAVNDALVLLENLISDSRLAFSAACAVEQCVNVLRLTDYPTFELLGTCVSLCRALTLAAPPCTVVGTEKLLRLYKRECRHVSKLVLSEFESWRLKGVGTVRVAHIRSKRNTKKKASSAEETPKLLPSAEVANMLMGSASSTRFQQHIAAPIPSHLHHQQQQISSSSTNMSSTLGPPDGQGSSSGGGGGGSVGLPMTTSKSQQLEFSSAKDQRAT